MSTTIPSEHRKVIFLCTGNSCRSQMAEAIVNARLSHRWQAFSAGTQPIGYVHPKAIEVLSEINIQHFGKSKSITEFKDQEFDLAVTVCDSAAEECPTWLNSGKQIHLSFPDPAKATGEDEQIQAKFREVRNAISIQIPELLDKY